MQLETDPIVQRGHLRRVLPHCGAELLRKERALVAGFVREAGSPRERGAEDVGKREAGLPREGCQV